VTHRPPTVNDLEGNNLAEKNWISGKEMRQKDIYMYHYSYVLPKQAQQKVGYYSHVAWTDAFRESSLWEQESYLKLSSPLFLGERGFPILQWLERFIGKHPDAILQLRKDLQAGIVKEDQRNDEDIEKLLSSPIYLLTTKLLRFLMPPYWAVRRWIKLKRRARLAQSR
jgi:hypothetical protein